MVPLHTQLQLVLGNELLIESSVQASEFKQNGSRPRVAVCFFGIPRSLDFTRSSIAQNILSPFSQFAETEVFVHFYDQSSINNPRTGEYGEINQDNTIWPNQNTILEEPGRCLDIWQYEDLKIFGDFWSDGFIALRNLIHQLHSIRSVAIFSEKYHADCTVFVRPDLWYYDDLSPIVKQALASGRDAVYLPYWQPFGGENDRFAVVVGKTAIDAYANRIQKASEFCEISGAPLHSESLLKYSLKNTKIFHIPTRAARVRSGGRVVRENFDLDWVDCFHRKVNSLELPYQLTRILHRTLNLIQDANDTLDRRHPIPKSQSGELLLEYPTRSRRLM